MMNVEIQEAKDNVQKRLDFIEGEIQKLDDSIAKLQGEQAEEFCFHIYVVGMVEESSQPLR